MISHLQQGIPEMMISGPGTGVGIHLSPSAELMNHIKNKTDKLFSYPSPSRHALNIFLLSMTRFAFPSLL